MKSVQRLMKWAMLVVPAFICLPTLAQESCQGVSQVVVQVHNVNYVPGAADGTPISAQMPLQSTNAFTCNKNNGEQGYNYKDMGFLINAEESGLQTNIAGGHNTPIYRLAGVDSIGFAIGFKEPAYCGSAFSDTTGKGKTSSICNSQTSPQFNSAHDITLQSYVVFYKIPGQRSPLNPGDQPANVGEVNIGNASLKVGDSATSSQPINDKPQLFLSSFTVQYGSCAVVTSQSAINVDMGKVSKAEFTGIGSRAGSQKGFQIQVMCEHSAAVKVGFFGTATQGDKDAISLTPQSNSASGVGIALTYGPGLQVPEGQRVPLNVSTDQLPVLTTVSSPNQAASMAFNAQYIQTDGQVMAGKADSTVTFNLVYN
ncbi:Pilin (type 1 fimbria component protein) [Candidatus Pantoea varia]|uniref:Pilin (Type 1 fimbria component protein) n=1 Tax=Candidatus Pantoea varia TaxID=1881036 RepID=A0A1I5E7N0_9GAMM|nr:fimbrial protein [Pantoea varia]SFO07111.1 Pilin (type 1 fimbria component protein) [Pantoea varia]